jgi:MFS family permease
MAVFSWLPPEWAWRALFAIGVVPALLVLYLRRNIPEPPRAALLPDEREVAHAKSILARPVLRVTIVGGLIGAGAHGGYHAISTWLPTYLATERNLSVLGTGAHLSVIIAAFIIGCFISAYLQDRIGRRKNLMLFATCCMATVSVYMFLPMSNVLMLLMSFPLGLFAAGIPSTLGALFNEIYPRNIRGRGVGFCYNFGRIASAGFPVVVGHLAGSMPLGVALGITTVAAYGLVIVSVYFLPETRGRSLSDTRETQPCSYRAIPKGDAASARQIEALYEKRANRPDGTSTF